MAENGAIKIFASLDDLSLGAAELVRATAAASIAKHGRFNLVLSGGSTPRRLFKRLARMDRSTFPWQKTHVFWTDERYVPPDHPDSNFGVAEMDLLLHVPIPNLQIHRIPTHFRSHESAAIEYEVRLRGLFPDFDAPAFDLALLGLGEDGHTASLFPGTVVDDGAWVAPVTGPDWHPPRERITLTLQALNGSRIALFLVCGSAKHRALRAVLDGSGSDLPAARIQPREELIWLTDRTAYEPASEDA